METLRTKKVLKAALNFSDDFYYLSDKEKDWLSSRMKHNSGVINLFNFGIMKERQSEYDIGSFAPVAIMSDKR